MSKPDERWTDGSDGSQRPRMVPAPAPHAGVVRALHAAFDPPRTLPDDWAKLLGRLR